MQGALEQLKSEVGDSLSVLALHFSAPFTVAGVTARANYYGVAYTPTVWFDGVFQKVGSANAYNVFRNYFNQRKVVDSPLSLAVTVEDFDGGTGVGHARCKVVNVGQSSVSAHLRFVATGDDTLGNWGYFNGAHDVAVDIFPTATGVAVALSPGETFETVVQFDIPLGWRHKPCTITGFVQDDGTKQILQAAMQHQVVMGLSADAVGGELALTWSAISGAGWYWIYGAANEAYFTPGLVFPYPKRVMVVPSGTTSWSTPNGIGDPDHNYSYMVIAVDGSQRELTRSNRVGEFDFSVSTR